MHLSTHNWMRAEPLEVTLRRIKKFGYESIEISGEPEQYKTKEKLLSSNVHALHLGRDWALQNLKCPITLRVGKSDKVGDRIFLEGNSAAALGAVTLRLASND